MVATVAAPAPAALAADQLPDLIILPLRDFRIETSNGRRLLRFTSIIANNGPGRFVVRGTRASTSEPEMSVSQRVYDTSGGYRVFPTPAKMFWSGDGHNHWHVRNLAAFDLVKVSDGVKVGAIAKIGYCFYDNYEYRLSLPGAPQYPFYTGCGSQSALGVTMGLSVGWGDEYPYYLAYQWVDVTDLPAGSYRLISTVNQFSWFLEENENNNITIADVELTDSSPVPAAPTGLSASAVSASQIELAWTDNSSNETGFKIDRCKGAGCTSFSQIATVGANTTAYSNTGLSTGTTYRYRVRAYNGGGNSAYTNVAEATTQSASLPAAPTALAASAVSTSQIDLAWTDNASNETGFKIERCEGSGCTSFSQIATVGADVTAYNSTGLNAGTLYRYRVRAYNGSGNSAYTNVAEATTQSSSPPPPPPSGTVTAFPAAVSVQVGSLKSGGAAQLNADDDAYFEVNSTPTSPTTRWELTFTGVPNVGSNLKITYSGKNSRTCTQRVLIRNYATASWVTLDSRAVGPTEVPIELSPPGAFGDYVSGTSGNGDVRLRIRCVTSSGTFFTSADLASITYST